MRFSEYESCLLCARNCGVNRYERTGFCSMSSDVMIARAALHHWEEPPISGTRGSGTIFFAGCSLSCIYCQNREISRGRAGEAVDISRLSEIMIDLQAQKAHNINLVTPTHFVPSIREAITEARNKGLNIPIVYNTGSYDTVDTIKSLEGFVDVYLPDYKYYLPKTAKKYSYAEDYPTVAFDAISEMVRQTGSPVFDDNGIMKRGTIVRILLLPGHVAESKLALKKIYDSFGDRIYVSLMNQYTPMPGMNPPLDRVVSVDEYRQLTDYADKIGLTNGFTQERGTAKESFIPPFDCSGVKK